MYKLMLIYVCMMMLTGCYYRGNDTMSNVVDDISDSIERSSEDIVDNAQNYFRDIEKNISLDSISSEDIENYYELIKNEYENIKTQITDDQKARELYKAAAYLDYYEEKNENHLTDKQEDALEIGEHIKELIMYHYGYHKDDLIKIQREIEEKLQLHDTIELD